MGTFWDKDIEKWYKHFANSWDRPSREYIRTVLSLGQYNNILECGFGSGDIPLYINRKGIGIKYTGIEITKGFLEKAGVVFPQHTFIEGSIEKLPFKDGSFELAYSRHIMEYLTNYREAFYELRRVTEKRVVVVFFRITSDKDIICDGEGYWDNYYGLPGLKDFLSILFSNCEYHFIHEGEPYLNLIVDCEV